MTTAWRYGRYATLGAQLTLTIRKRAKAAEAPLIHTDDSAEVYGRLER